MIFPNELLLESYNSYILDHHCFLRGVDLEVERVPVRDYFVPDKFIPIIFKLKHIKGDHWCFQTCAGDNTLNGWLDREELCVDLKARLTGTIEFYITTKSISVLAKAKLLSL